MGIFLKEKTQDSWIPAGDWFDRLVELPKALDKFEKTNSVQVTRILLAVPSRPLVACAICWGLSKHAFDNPLRPAETFPVDEIESIEHGTKVRLIFPVGRGVQSKISADAGSVRNTTVGIFGGASKGGSHLRAIIEVNGQKKTLALAPTVRFSIESEETPQGIYFEAVQTGQDEKAARRNFFNSQQNPQALVFTEVDHFQEELSLSFSDSSLREALGQESMTIQEAIRVDRHSADSFSHFINVWENVKSFDQVATELGQMVNAFKMVILDGNVAIDLLANHEALRSKKVLGVFESGRNVIQERGVAVFLGEAMYLRQISDFQDKLEWRAPDGIKIWGWSL